ncbi:hypothetical protein D3C76_1713230 [compost metagenome]
MIEPMFTTANRKKVIPPITLSSTGKTKATMALKIQNTLTEMPFIKPRAWVGNSSDISNQ